jgi:hypothetical protein
MGKPADSAAARLERIAHLLTWTAVILGIAVALLLFSLFY